MAIITSDKPIKIKLVNFNSKDCEWKIEGRSEAAGWIKAGKSGGKPILVGLGQIEKGLPIVSDKHAVFNVEGVNTENALPLGEIVANDHMILLCLVQTVLYR